MTQETELPALPDYDPDLQGAEIGPGYARGFRLDQLRAYADARVAAAVLAERERCSFRLDSYKLGE